MCADIESLIDQVSGIEWGLDHELDRTVRIAHDISAHRPLCVEALVQNGLGGVATKNNKIVQKNAVVIRTDRQSRNPLRIVDKAVVEGLAILGQQDGSAA